MLHPPSGAHHTLLSPSSHPLQSPSAFRISAFHLAARHHRPKRTAGTLAPLERTVRPRRREDAKGVGRVGWRHCRERSHQANCAQRAAAAGPREDHDRACPPRSSACHRYYYRGRRQDSGSKPTFRHANPISLSRHRLLGSLSETRWLDRHGRGQDWREPQGHSQAGRD